MSKNPKQVVPVRLGVEQRQRIAEVVKHSSILDESKFIRLAIDFTLEHNIGEVIALMHTR